VRRERGKGYWVRERGREEKGRGKRGKWEGEGKGKGGGVCVIGVRGIDAPGTYHRSLYQYAGLRQVGFSYVNEVPADSGVNPYLYIFRRGGEILSGGQIDIDTLTFRAVHVYRRI